MPLKVETKDVPGQQTHYGNPFPLAYLCSTEDAILDDAMDWARTHKEELIAQAADCGVLFFRGFPLVTPEDFDAFVTAFDLPCFAYDESLSNAVRINYTPQVFSANEAPPEVNINLHHEMAQTPAYPSKLFFFCQTAAEVGGASSVCRSDVLWEQLVARRPAFARACEEKGLKYTHVMPACEDPQSGMGRSWKSTFSAETRSSVETRMTELGYTWQWLEGDCLRATTSALPATRVLDSGRKAFFNQLIAAFTGWEDSRNESAKALTFGDGSPMDVEGARLASDLAENLIFEVPWQSGDAALVDNYVAMHGRRTFQGTRKVLASFVA
jgi:alpha-ketoglutarate-dependent taurine dioxygenase|tara:strand:- start:2451 stop:3428 length:978 start_codon:yes stop_codon:yes gene_type:complete